MKNPNRRTFLRRTLGTTVAGAAGVAGLTAARGEESGVMSESSESVTTPENDAMLANGTTVSPSSTPITVGGERQLFVDDYLIARMEKTMLRVHSPQRREIAFTFDAPWEGDAQNYFTTMFDGEKYHMYYHAWGQFPSKYLYIAYLHSDDGIHWERPNLGIVEFEGSKENNIVMGGMRGMMNHDFNPFLDKNPAATSDAKFKATGMMIGSGEDFGVYAFQSSDAVHWTPISEKPVFGGWAFDTQNVSFWSESEQKYILYYRHFRENIRVIRRATSDDFCHWTDEGEIEFPENQGPTPTIQFYTNQIAPYYRNRHLYIGFPARYVDHGLTVSTDLLPEPELRHERIAVEQRLGTTVTDSIFIASRDGHHFTQSNDVFLAPGLRTRHNWCYGDNYMSWGIFETESQDDDSPRELSLYATESYQTGDQSRIRRYTLRIDGFCSLHATSQSGDVWTKPIIFEGKELSLNAATSAAGTIKVELCTPDGNVIPGYGAEDCDLIYGDSLDRRVSWHGNADLSAWAIKPIVLHFILCEADVYSMQWMA